MRGTRNKGHPHSLRKRRELKPVLRGGGGLPPRSARAFRGDGMPLPKDKRRAKPRGGGCCGGPPKPARSPAKESRGGAGRKASRARARARRPPDRVIRSRPRARRGVLLEYSQRALSGCRALVLVLKRSLPPNRRLAPARPHHAGCAHRRVRRHAARQVPRPAAWQAPPPSPPIFPSHRGPAAAGSRRRVVFLFV